MCLAVPVRVVSINGNAAEVDIGGVTKSVSVLLTPEVRVGDYVLLHTGFAITVVDEAEANETMKLFQEMTDLDEIH
jgi:hydrogenase expression/formation protein HypC